MSEETTNELQLGESGEEKLRICFKHFDTNKDGRISKDELQKAFHSIGNDLTDEETDEMFPKGEDSVDFEMFKVLVMQNYKELPVVVKIMSECFNKFDSNKDGYLSKDELRRALELNNKKMDDTEFEEIFQKADTNNDNKIDIYEFVTSTFCKAQWSLEDELKEMNTTK